MIKKIMQACIRNNNIGFLAVLMLILASCSSQKFSSGQNDFAAAQFNISKPVTNKAIENNPEISFKAQIPSAETSKTKTNVKKITQKIEARSKKFVAKIEREANKIPQIINNTLTLQKATVRENPVWEVTWKDVVFFIVWLLILSVLVVIARMLGIGPVIYLLGAALLTVIIIGIYVYWNQNPTYPR